MPLNNEMIRAPIRVRRNMKKHIENYCALIIAVLSDTTPEEAFLSVDNDKVFRFIDHKRYSTDDIYKMLDMRSKGATLTEIGERFNLTPKMVAQVIKTYDIHKPVAEFMKDQDMERWRRLGYIEKEA